MKRSSLLLALVLFSNAKHALAVDLSKGEDPVRLDVTETSILSQRFLARELENPLDQGFGQWLNRLNIALRWGKWTLGTRLDSSLYWLRPQDRSDIPASQERATIADGLTRFPNSIYPAKLWATFNSKKLELTVGDAYAQFGRGLVLSLRKVDELGLDTTARGVKATLNAGIVSTTVIAGLANPTRVDEASGRSLFLPKVAEGATRGPDPVFGSDRLIGFQIEAGKGLPVVLSTHGSRLARCAPYAYGADGSIQSGIFASPLGACGDSDVRGWLSAVPNSDTPVREAKEIDTIAQSLHIPSLWKHGSLYVEAAVQTRRFVDPEIGNGNGNAIYGSLSLDAGPLTNTLEIKSYRNFYSAPGAIDTTRAIQFNNVLYSAPPTTQVITMDAEFGAFNVCVNGGRLRSNLRTSDSFLLWAAAAYYFTESEVTGGGCDYTGRGLKDLERDKGLKTQDPNRFRNSVYDFALGVEHSFDDDKSQLLASIGGRDDHTWSGEMFYQELWAMYTLSKHIKGSVSFEINGRNRFRRQENLNKPAGGGVGSEAFWAEGQVYAALKIAPKWVFSPGFEYTTLQGFPVTYFNGNVLYRFSSESNIKLLVGQQRGGLKCVSGVCRIFPAFEGARAEYTLRF